MRAHLQTLFVVLCAHSARFANRWHGVGRWDLVGNANDTFFLYINKCSVNFVIFSLLWESASPSVARLGRWRIAQGEHNTIHPCQAAHCEFVTLCHILKAKQSSVRRSMQTSLTSIMPMRACMLSAVLYNRALLSSNGMGSSSLASHKATRTSSLHFVVHVLDG